MRGEKAGIVAVCYHARSFVAKGTTTRCRDYWNHLRV